MEDRYRPGLVFAAALAVVGLGVIALALLSDRFEGNSDPTAPPSGVSQEPGSAAPSAADVEAAIEGEGHGLVNVLPGEPTEVLDAPVGEPIGFVGGETAFGAPTALALAEREGPWLGVETELAGSRPLGWIRFAPERLDLDATPWSLRIVLGDRVVDLRRDGKVAESYRATVSGEQAIPLGRHGVSDKLPAGVSPSLGAGALALTAVSGALGPDSPTGDRISIHGGEGEAGVAVGLRLDDADLKALADRAPIGAPVFIEP
ncbi:MAG: L,D-transpeptidase [Solirubrobacterales bacterium]